MGEKLGESPGKNFLLSMGFLVGKGVENNARGAHFLAKMAQGESELGAMQSVVRSLFDYSDLSKVEKWGKNNFLPFYTFTRKNVPLQFAHLIESPAKFTAIRKFKQTIEGDDAPATSDMPEFFRDGVPLTIGKDNKGKPSIFLLGGWFPLTDIEKLIGPAAGNNLTHARILDEGLNLIFPGIQRAFELSTNYEIFRNKTISDFPGDEEKFLGVNMHPGIKRVLESVRLFAEFNRFVDTDLPLSQRLVRSGLGIRTFPLDMQRTEDNRLFTAVRNLGSLRKQRRRETALETARKNKENQKPDSGMLGRLFGGS
jgi:hypothetical protein